jgi:alkaline phosphatase D
MDRERDRGPRAIAPRAFTRAPRMLVPAIVVAVGVMGCGSAPAPTPGRTLDSATSIPRLPTPCVDPLQCQATVGPIRTLPPIPTATPDPFATPRTTVTPGASMRIALAGCLFYAPGGTALGDIALQAPDLMLWLGDNIYADTIDIARMRSIYDSLGANPRFRALRDTVETMATWDDHDYAYDNANRTASIREESKAEFLRFWGATADDPRWTQPGVYSARTFGSGDRTVQVILLDNRYSLDRWDYEGVDPARRILGDEQWAWLRERLLEPATIRIIGSGVQVVQDYDISEAWESWGDSPLEQARLFALIRELRVPGVVFVSGDMHFAELSRHRDDAAALGYPTYDLSGAGLDRIETENEGQWDNPNRVGGLLNSNRKHGLVEIDWAPPDPEIHLELWDGRSLFLDHVVRLSELQPA